MDCDKAVEDSPHSITITEVFDSLSLKLGGADNFFATILDCSKPSEINKKIQVLFK